VIAGRSGKRLENAEAELGHPDRLRTVTVNIGDRSQVAALFEHAQAVRHLVVTAADLPYGPVTELSEDSIMRAVRTKFLGPYFAAQEAAPRMKAGGSITFTSGIAARRPAPGGSLGSAGRAGSQTGPAGTDGSTPARRPHRKPRRHRERHQLPD
jgi:NAD(P)-dependent dehydrogenase (short-subunit alcohol dehydrogenase family)